MFDHEFKAERPPAQRARRTVLLIIVAAMFAWGAFSLVRDWIIGDDEPAPASEQSTETEEEPTPGPSAPTEAGTASADQVPDWFPHTPAQFAEGGAVAAEFITEFATIDYETEEFEDYTDRLGEYATDAQAVTLTTPDGIAQATYKALGTGSATSWTGHGEVVEIVHFEPSAVHYVVEVTATPDTDQDPVDLGAYLIVMTTAQGPGWEVELADPHRQ